MEQRMSEADRLGLLVEAFKADSGTYARLETPGIRTAGVSCCGRL